MYGSETKQHPMCTSDGLPVDYGGLLCCTYRCVTHICVTFATEEGCPVVPQCVPDNPWEYLVFKNFKGCLRDDPSRTQVPWDVPYVLVGTLSTQYSRNPRFILGCPHVLHIHPASLNTKYPGNLGIIPGCPHVLHIHSGSLDTKYPRNPGMSPPCTAHTDCTLWLRRVHYQPQTEKKNRKKKERSTTQYTCTCTCKATASAPQDNTCTVHVLSRWLSW